MNTELGGLFSSRINMNLREEHGYTYGADRVRFRRGAGPFQIATGVRTDVTAPAVTEILKEVRAMASAPMTAERARARKRLADTDAARRFPDQPGDSRQLRDRCTSMTSVSTTTPTSPTA